MFIFYFIELKRKKYRWLNWGWADDCDRPPAFQQFTHTHKHTKKNNNIVRINSSQQIYSYVFIFQVHRVPMHLSSRFFAHSLTHSLALQSTLSTHSYCILLMLTCISDKNQCNIQSSHDDRLAWIINLCRIKNMFKATSTQRESHTTHINLSINFSMIVIVIGWCFLTFERHVLISKTHTSNTKVK